MKRLIVSMTLLSLILIPCASWAITPVTFAWDPYIDAPLVDGFRLYERGKTDPLTSRVKKAEFAGGTTTQGNSMPAALGERCWVLTAFSTTQNLESDPSDEVCVVVKPTKPMKVIIKNATVEITGELEG